MVSRKKASVALVERNYSVTTTKGVHISVDWKSDSELIALSWNECIRGHGNLEFTVGEASGLANILLLAVAEIRERED